MRDWMHRQGIAVLAVGLLVVWGWGASAQPLDLRIDRGQDASGVFDYEFSWIYWWEAHGQAYLRECVAERELPISSPPTRRFRGDAIDALLPMLDDTDARVREQAVIALARIGHEPLEDAILGWPDEPVPEDRWASGWLIDDPDESVRCACWVALGLLDTERSRAKLAEPMALPEREQVSRVGGVGLLSELADGHLAALSALLTDADTSVEVKRWVIWAIGQHDEAIPPERRDAMYRWAMENIASPFVLSQILSSPDYVERQGGARWLVQVLRYYPAIRELPGYAAIRGQPDGTAHGSSPTRLSMETRLAALQSLAHLPPPESQRDRVALRETLLRRAMAGNRAGLLDFNRGADAIAFALHSDANPEDLDRLYDLLRGFTVIPTDEADPLEEGADLTASDLLERQSDNEVRSYTAIAVGLLIRRETEGTALYDAWPREHLRGIQLERLKRRFGQRLSRAIADADEPLAYRAACALALGLTADPRYVPVLTQELSRLQGGDEVVLGYGLLALAMLGDERVSDPVSRYVNRPGTVGGVDDLIGRRAALQALAVLGDAGADTSRQAIEQAWGRDPWLSIEVGRVTHWSGHYDALPKMLDASRAGSVRWRVASALSLGAALDRSFPPRIEALSAGACFAMSYRRVPPVVEPADDDIVLPPPVVEGEDASGGADSLDATTPPAATPTSYPEGWPMRDLPARGNPFWFERLLAP
ncbi:MAG: HEAT repeat domain-containing protein [Planctomycetota bacterium]